MKKDKVKHLLIGFMLGIFAMSSVSFAADKSKTIKAIFTNVNILNNNVLKEKITVINYNSDYYIPWSKVSKYLGSNVTFNGREMNIKGNNVTNTPSSGFVKINEPFIVENKVKVVITKLTKANGCEIPCWNQDAPEGKEYVCAHVTAQNIGKVQTDFTWLGSIVSGKGQINQSFLVNNDNNNAIVVKLAPNGIASSKVYFLRNKDDKDAYLQYVTKGLNPATNKVVNILTGDILEEE